MRKAVVDRKGKVLNVIVWEEGSSWPTPPNCVLIDAERAGEPGDTWDGYTFTSSPKPEPSPSIEERVKRLEAKLLP